MKCVPCPRKCEADLSGAILDGADLSGAKLEDAIHVLQSQLDEACGDADTTLPEGLTIQRCPEESE